jgi:hypothetical protein
VPQRAERGIYKVSPAPHCRSLEPLREGGGPPVRGRTIQHGYLAAAPILRFASTPEPLRQSYARGFPTEGLCVSRRLLGCMQHASSVTFGLAAREGSIKLVKHSLPG